MNKRLLTLSLLLLGLWQCSEKKTSEADASIPTGHWRAVIHTQGQELPFNLITRQNEQGQVIFLLKNGEEEIILDKHELRNDTLYLPMHIFDAQIIARISGGRLEGIWTKNYVEDYALKFEATLGEKYRFPVTENPIDYDFSGKWAATFQIEDRTYPAIGELVQRGDEISGTFITKSGDYRFLEGNLTEDGFQLSTFDGEHAYLFRATLVGTDSLSGEFWTGKTGYRPWKAYRDEAAHLPEAAVDFSLSDEANSFSFSYPNENGKMISLDDERYQDKVVIVQLLGSWCPNCMDETAFLARWYEENNARGVEIIGLAYERKGKFEYGASRIGILKERYNIGYEILFAGKNDRETHQQLSLIEPPFIFPTTIFIDKKGSVRKVHKGFSGPGTGEHYQKLIKEFNATVDALVEERP